MPEDHPTLESAASERERALTHEEGPLLVVGAPGTGKTELLAHRLAHLVQQGNRPESVLMIASRPATAARLRERCEALLQGSFEELWIGGWDAIGEPSGWRCCSTASTNCRCAGTRSVATRPACWPGCWSGSTG
jgi:primosomal protein N'